MSTKLSIKPRRRLLNLALLAALGGGALASASASAADLYWACGAAAWDDPCWSSTPGGAPVLGPPLPDGDNGFQSTGSLSAYDETIGWAGTSTFTQSGGTNTVSNFLTLGKLNGSNGSYALSGLGTLTAGFEFIGRDGIGAFTQSGFQHTVNNIFVLGVNSGSNGSYTLNSGLLSAKKNETIGSYGTGSFTQIGGTHAVTGGLTLSTFSGSNGSYTLNSGNLSAGSEIIGHHGTGASFTQNGGTNTVKYDLALGYGTTGNGSYIMSGNSGLLTNGSEIIGSEGTGVFTQNDGSHAIKQNLSVGAFAGSNGSFILNSGKLSVGLIEDIGQYGTGTFTQNGGEHTVGEHLSLGSWVSNAGSGTYNLMGGTLAVLKGINNWGSFYVGTGTTATVGGIGFYNRGGALLSGGGTIAGNVTSFGTVGPGNSPGVLSIEGNYTQWASGTYAAEIGGLLAGTQYDVLNVSGTAFLDGLLNVSLFDLGSGLFAPQAGDYFDILTANTITGSFSSLSFAALSNPNLFWHIEYLTDAIGATDVVRLSIGQNVVPTTPVPEPETYAMLLAGLGLLGFTARRRKNNAA